MARESPDDESLLARVGEGDGPATDITGLPTATLLGARKQKT